MAYSSSKTWISNEARETERWQAIVIAMRRICHRSPFVPWTLKDWVAHKAACIEIRNGRSAEETVLATIKDGVGTLAERSRIMRPFGGKTLSSNLSAVLVMPTIWCHGWDTPDRVTAPWPGLKESKWEGDDRARTGVSRFLPLPREPANATVAWHHRRMLLAEALDEVWRVPTLEDVYLPVDEIDEVEIPRFLNSDVLSAMDVVNRL